MDTISGKANDTISSCPSSIPILKDKSAAAISERKNQAEQYIRTWLILSTINLLK